MEQRTANVSIPFTAQIGQILLFILYGCFNKGLSFFTDIQAYAEILITWHSTEGKKLNTWKSKWLFVVEFEKLETYPENQAMAKIYKYRPESAINWYGIF